MRAFVLVVGACVVLAGCASHQKPNYATAAEAYAGVTDARSYWARELDLASLSNTGNFANSPAKYKTCVVDEVTRTTAPEVAIAIDRFVANKSDANYEAVVAASEKTYDANLTNQIAAYCKEQNPGDYVPGTLKPGQVPNYTL